LENEQAARLINLLAGGVGSLRIHQGKKPQAKFQKHPAVLQALHQDSFLPLPCSA
jgi:hypothetical protein